MDKPFVKIFTSSSLSMLQDQIEGWMEENKVKSVSSVSTIEESKSGYAQYISTICGVLNNE